MRRWLPIMFWFGVWIAVSHIVHNGILIATPLQTGEKLISLLGKGRFYLTLGSSLLRIGGGFLAGFSLAVLLAAAGFRYGFLEELLKPFMSLIKTVPVASFVVLLLVWWGSSLLAAVICFLVALPNVYMNVLEGLKNMNIRLLEMARVHRLPFRNRFFYIYRPALKPFVYGSLKISLGMCWKAGVAAEVIGIPNLSIGEQLYLSKIYLDTAGVFAWTGVIILLSAVLEKGVMRLADNFFAWEPACRPQHSPRAAGASKREFPRAAGASKRESPRVAGAFKQESPRAAGASKREFPRETDAFKQEFRLEHIAKSYCGQKVLEDVNRVYRQGECYYLTEPSGSGKTTLLRILAGLTEPDAGTLTGPESCSMVFQEDRLCEEYSAVKNVELVTGNAQAAEDALALLLEREVLHRPCSRLSGGMKRRVALVRAMEADSDCVLLDEPFTGMDEETCRRAREYIRSRQKGRILITATHINVNS